MLPSSPAPDPHPAAGRRGRLTAFVARHQVSWELAMATLTLVYVVLTLLDDEAVHGLPEFLTVTLSLVFLAEFGARCWDSPSRIAYLRGHWIDLVTCIPAVGPLRALRLVRLLGLLRLAVRIRRLNIAHGRRSPSMGPWMLMPTLVLVWFGAAEIFWLTEHGRNESVRSFGDALYLAITTATTVGYGDIKPVTPEGRLIAGVLVFIGLGLLGLASSRLALHWLRTERETIHLEREVRALREEVARLAEAVRAGAEGESASVARRR
jgi:voltage-gated potassium channel